MSSDPLSLVVIAKNLDTCQGNEFQTVLRTLKSTSYLNQQLLKSDLSIFMAKVLKLLRSNDNHAIWKGCHLVNVFCSYNALVLSSFAGELMTALYSKLEPRSSYYVPATATIQERVVLSNLVNTISIMIDLIRDKPSLTREALTPKLSVIIPTLVSLSENEPGQCLPVLKKLLYRNTTTFKPYANKFRRILLNLINRDYESFNENTKRLVCDCFAYLHLIKKTAQNQDETKSHHKAYLDENWREGMLSVLFEFKPVIQLCGEVLDFNVDSGLCKLLDSLLHPRHGSAQEGQFLLPLNVDMNEPLTIWKLAARFRLLTDLLISFISSPTPYALRIPMGEIIKISDCLLTLTSNYLPLKRGLFRDSSLISSIDLVFPQVQFQGIRLLNCMTSEFGKSILPYLPTILSSLELFIPLQNKTSNINYEKCDPIREEIFEVADLINAVVPHVGHRLEEQTLIIKLTDVFLYLLESKSKIDLISVKQTKKTSSGISKKKKNKSDASGSMSDLYSHPHLFVVKSELKSYDHVNRFFQNILTNWKLPSTQQVKIIKHTVLCSLLFKEQSGDIPKSFVELLTTLVLHPGNERVSILPIAVSLLKETGNPVLDVICNPKLPVQTIQIVRKPIQHADEELTDANLDTLNSKSTSTTVNSESPEIIRGKPSVITDLDIVERSTSHETSKVFKRGPSEPNDLAKQEAKRPKPMDELVKCSVTSSSEPKEVLENASSSDEEFEIPEINLSEEEEDS
ncbi:Rix1p Ecym_5157 [Eremothecium cymbalariae DBVPG|uniref:Pre-rRNA-processing protein RIX1 n=1 Tax=Eremothecium cymbalariae (strain CBS 270.75 / DBVPG 7215 / KCTC 17166 / NRRL Y-17582) TaxID=931890 RepID=I6NCZ1_ERECY|nr:hypothetical protein Ecym_5157 [Eremothecium cymbalariae DBVPG\